MIYYIYYFFDVVSYEEYINCAEAKLGQANENVHQNPEMYKINFKLQSPNIRPN